MSFPRYPSYKDSGVEWLGEVPEHWEVKPLRRLVDSTNAGEVIDRTFWGGESEILYSCALQPLDCDYEGFPEWKRTTLDDLLLTRNGTPYVHKPVEKAIYTNVVQRITLTSGEDRNYIATALQNSAGNLKGYGVSIESLNYDMWKALPVAIPTLQEQTHIAVFLGHETAQIDALVAEQRRLMELLKEKRQAVISHAVAQGLNHHSPMKPSGIEWLGDVPAHWDGTPIKYVAKVGNGSTPSREIPEYWGETGFPWLNSSVVNSNVVTEAEGFVTERALRECHLPVITPPAILVGITGQGRTRGMAAMLGIEATINQHVAYVKPSTSGLDVRYLLRVLESAYLKLRLDSEEAGATKGAITCEQIKNLHVPLPPLVEQIAISAFLDTESAKFDTLTAEAQRAIDLLQERRTALISAAVTGQIKVTSD